MPTPPARYDKPRPRRAFPVWQGADDGKTITPALKLRVFAYDNPRRLFVEVFVWDFVYQLRGIRRQGKGHKTTRAFFHPRDEIRKSDTGRTVASRKIGEIHFCRKFCTYETVAHECYHATRYFSHRMRHKEAADKAEYDSEPIKWDMPEERNARFHGMLTDRVIAAILRLLHSPKTRSVQICTDRKKRGK